MMGNTRWRLALLGLGALIVLLVACLLRRSGSNLAYVVVDTGQESCFDDRGPIPYARAGRAVLRPGRLISRGPIPLQGQRRWHYHQPEHRIGLAEEPAPRAVHLREGAGLLRGLELAGYDDWRLPNVKELQSILDYTRIPAISPVFSLTDPGAWFWTSTTQAGAPRHAWYVVVGRAFSVHGFDAYGAGAIRSDPKSGDSADWP